MSEVAELLEKLQENWEPCGSHLPRDCMYCALDACFELLAEQRSIIEQLELANAHMIKRMPNEWGVK
jgi:hypothetical protein